jgi:hypothetical protein
MEIHMFRKFTTALAIAIMATALMFAVANASPVIPGHLAEDFDVSAEMNCEEFARTALQMEHDANTPWYEPWVKAGVGECALFYDGPKMARIKLGPDMLGWQIGPDSMGVPYPTLGNGQTLRGKNVVVRWYNSHDGMIRVDGVPPTVACGDVVKYIRQGFNRGKFRTSPLENKCIKYYSGPRMRGFEVPQGMVVVDTGNKVPPLRKNNFLRKGEKLYTQGYWVEGLKNFVIMPANYVRSE